ncbi:MAG: hypothetical protein AAF824_23290 [Bacteroidota bacterium]
MLEWIKNLITFPKTGALISRSQVVAVCSSFLLAVILWILVTLSQTYTAEFIFPIKLTEVPTNIQIETISSPEVVVDLGGTGTDLIFEDIRTQKDSLSVPYTDFDENGHIYALSLQRALRAMVPSQINIQEVRPGDLFLTYNKKVTKKVPLVSLVKVNLRSAFQLENKPVLMPDSVEIIGNSQQLDTIHHWFTAKVETPRLGVEASELTIPIEDTVSRVTVSPKSATLFLQPRRYTEQMIEVPVLVEGNPKTSYVTLQTNTLKVICLVPLENYKELEDASYVWTIPFDSLDTRVPYLIPDISFLPEYVKVIRVEPFQMSYVITNRQT